MSSFSRTSSNLGAPVAEGELQLKNPGEDWERVWAKLTETGYLQIFANERAQELLKEIDLSTSTVYENPVSPTYKKNCFEISIENESNTCFMFSTSSEMFKNDWVTKLVTTQAACQGKRVIAEDAPFVKEFKYMMKLEGEDMVESKTEALKNISRVGRAMSVYMPNSLEGDLTTNASSISDHTAQFIDILSKSITDAKPMNLSLSEIPFESGKKDEFGSTFDLLSKALIFAAKLGKAWLNHEPGLESISRKKSLTRSNAQRMISVKKVPHSDKHHYQAESTLDKSATSLREIKLADIKPNEHMVNALSSANSENFRALKERLETTCLASIAREIKFLKSAINQLVAIENYLSKYVFPDYTATFHMGGLLKLIHTRIKRLLVLRATYIQVATASLKTSKEAPTNFKANTGSKEPNVNIWDDQTTLIKVTDQKTREEKVSGGSLNQLIMYMVNNQDASFLETFMTCYQSFTSSLELLEKFKQLYQGPPAKFNEVQLLRTRLRVCILLRYWIQLQSKDFEHTMFERLTEFLKSMMKDGKEMAEMSARLSAELAQKDVDKKEMPSESKFSLITSSFGSPISQFMQLDELDIARQLTMVDSKILNKIESSELLRQAWSKPNLQYKSSNIVAMIERANHISFWTSSMILWHVRVEERVKVIEKFVKIAENLKLLNNFNTLISVIAGLVMSPISRLKITWSRVSKEAAEKVKNIQQLFDSTNSYKQYRQARFDASCRGPFIPYLGVTLSDLVYAEENPDFLRDHPTMINFIKREIIAKIIRDFQLCQQKPYSFSTAEPVLTFVTELPHFDSKELYELSVLREPRDFDAKGVEQLEHDFIERRKFTM